MAAEAMRLPPNGLAFSCGERAAWEHVKKATISRAKRSAAMPGWAALSCMVSFKLVLCNELCR